MRKIKNIASFLLMLIILSTPYTFEAVTQTPQQRIDDMKQKISGVEKEYADAHGFHGCRCCLHLYFVFFLLRREQPAVYAGSDGRFYRDLRFPQR